ncbi:MAG: DoxX family protein [Acidimicrobiia bacterium]|nr:DoxX family protein [Acidimicrobiia bacterium]
MKTLNHALGRLGSYGPLIIRLILGVLFVLHGWDKFSDGLSNVEGFFDSNGVPAAALTAPLVAISEIVLGVALIAGLATRIAALLLAGIMVGAIIWVKNDAILGGAEQELAYLAGLIGLIFLGPGRLSADEVMGNDSPLIDLGREQTSDATA